MTYQQPSLPTYHCNRSRPVTLPNHNNIIKRLLQRISWLTFVKLIIQEKCKPVKE
uniref:Uncharacterized protein n=1 Tax=Arundo donax TaxID=35708 RepID=A0A0A9EMG2_ARUDO